MEDAKKLCVPEFFFAVVVAQALQSFSIFRGCVNVYCAHTHIHNQTHFRGVKSRVCH